MVRKQHDRAMLTMEIQKTHFLLGERARETTGRWRETAGREGVRDAERERHAERESERGREREQKHDR